MPVEPGNAAEARAIDWLVRQRDPAFDEWDGFADWLAEDAAHPAIYDAIASLDRDLDALPAAPRGVTVVDTPAPRRLSRRRWFGGAVAAALVGAIGLSLPGLWGSDGRIETAAGEHRTITLADGSTIDVNGGSVIEIDEERPRFARLETGEAMFRVVHRDGDPFIVETGDARIVDLGTAFNVVRRDRVTSVAVSEGLVVYNPDRDNVRLAAGKGLDARDGDSAPPAAKDVEIANIGGWRRGLLVYNGAPLSIVAEDLRRTAGIQLSIAPDASTLSFRGALVIDKDRSRTIADLAALSGTRAERQGEGWLLTR
ncbi:FecR family protein [Sphingopyxis kveilinensis]|uniref:FecR family protein n=1 Tax=Sphingopyxis kveilinensis TaxID=3114367 RepID=UPI0030CE0A46